MAPFSEKEFAHLQTLLPKPPAHHPIMRFALSIYLPELAASVAVLIDWRTVRLYQRMEQTCGTHYKANHYCDPATHHFNEDIRDSPSAIKKA